MTSNTLVISPVARDDLKQIFLYGGTHWGVSRTTRYLETLKNELWNLTDHPKMGINRDDLFPAMRSLSVESHVIFYRLKSRQIEIVRVLHGRQNPQFHLK